MCISHNGLHFQNGKWVGQDNMNSKTSTGVGLDQAVYETVAASRGGLARLVESVIEEIGRSRRTERPR